MSDYDFDSHLLEASRPNRSSPYLDVMSITCAESVSALHEQEHSKLLIEPISIPELKHTAAKTSLDATGGTRPRKQEDVTLFYPNGKKNKNLRKTIQEALRSVEETLPAHPYHLKDHEALMAETKRRKRKTGRFKRRKSKGKQSRESDEMTVLSTTSSVVLTHRSRPAEVEAEKLLSKLREESSKLHMIQY